VSGIIISRWSNSTGKTAPSNDLATETIVDFAGPLRFTVSYITVSAAAYEPLNYGGE
jgi:hypothetical protein